MLMLCTEHFIGTKKSFFLLILKEIKTLSWSLRGLVGSRHCLLCIMGK